MAFQARLCARESRGGKRVRECDYSPLKASLERLSVCDVWQRLGVEGKPGRNGKACRSPFRPDRNPSFSIYMDGRRWKDHATGEGGDAADFCAKARNLSREEGARLLIDLAGTRRVDPVPKGNSGNAKWQGNPSRSGPGNPDPYDSLKDRKRPASAKAGRPSRRPHKRRSRQSPCFEDCPPRASLSPPSEVCSFAPTQRKAAPGSSQISAG